MRVRTTATGEELRLLPGPVPKEPPPYKTCNFCNQSFSNAQGYGSHVKTSSTCAHLYKEQERLRIAQEAKSNALLDLADQAPRQEWLPSMLAGIVGPAASHLPANIVPNNTHVFKADQDPSKFSPSCVMSSVGMTPSALLDTYGQLVFNQKAMRWSLGIYASYSSGVLLACPSRRGETHSQPR